MRNPGVVSFGFLLLGALVLAGCANPAENKTEAKVAEPTEVMATVGGDRFLITEDSTIEWTGSKVTGSHEGGFRTFDGEITLVEGNPAASSVSVTIDTTSIWADHEKLTGHLMSEDFFEVQTYPTASFESTSIEPTAEGFSITGNLDLHGVTKSVTFPATISVQDGAVSAQAEFFIKRNDFGIVYPGKPDDLIRDEVVIRFDLTARPAEAKNAAGA